MHISESKGTSIFYVVSFQKQFAEILQHAFDFEVFWFEIRVAQCWRISAETAILLLPAPNGPKFESIVPLGF